MTQTVLELAEAVRSGRTSARALTEATLRRIALRDGEIGAFQIVRGDRALAEADAVDARTDKADLPLAGVPIAIKDNIAVTGEPMRDGAVASDPRPQTADHVVVARLRAAGAVVVGLTRVPELCVFGATDSAFGVTRNPWNLSRTPGGSSGGSAAAVAAGMVAAAHGNDGMGSIRIPAACCGLVGLKPGADVVPSGIGNNAWFGMAENGPLTTTVADNALLLSVMAAAPGLADAPTRTPEHLRVAVSLKAPGPATPVDPLYVEATRTIASVLQSAGHAVREADLVYSLPIALSALALWFAGTEMDARLIPDRARLEKRNRRHAAAGRAVLRAGLVRDKPRQEWRDEARHFFADADVLLTPGLAQIPLPAAEWGRRSWLWNVRASSGYAPFGAPWNLAGWPAIAVPAGVHPKRQTPLAVQLVAPPGGEATLLATAAQIEQLAPWQRVAPYYSGLPGD
ncbi:MAG: amidase [Frankiaceae bacterium]|nr:amidase [Frankiaceae bacterium]